MTTAITNMTTGEPRTALAPPAPPGRGRDFLHTTGAGAWSFTYDSDNVKQSSSRLGSATRHLVDGTFSHPQVLEDYTVTPGLPDALQTRYLRGLHSVRMSVGAQHWW
jgi:hypothetical protein